MNELAQYFYNSSVSKEKRNELLKKVDVNYCTPDTFPDKKETRGWAGYTSLHFAVEKNDLDLATELLRQGADVVKQSTEGEHTPLHVAIYKLYYCERLGLQEGEIREVQENIPSLINSLLSRQVEINNAKNPKCKKGISHLHIACLVNHVEAVELFVNAKESLNQRISNDVECMGGYTPLRCAINSLSVEAADILLRYGADIHVQVAEGLTCVHLLVHIMRLSDLIKMDKRTLCTIEEMERLESIIKLVLEFSIDDETSVGDSGLSRFHLACTLKNKAIAENFLKKGVDVNLPVKRESKLWSGWTPIHFAACLNIDMMILLMHKGADLTIKNSDGETALDVCAKKFTAADVELVLSMENGFKEIVLSDNCTKLSDLLLVIDNYNMFRDFLQKLENVNITIPPNSPIWPGYNLLHLSVSLNIRTKFTNASEETFDLPETTEHYNCTTKEFELYEKRLELLLEYGCNVDMKNAYGETPIHVVFRTNSGMNILNLLTHSEDNVVNQEGLSHLHMASLLGDLDVVKRYLNQGADVNCTWIETWRFHASWKSFGINSSPLHLAVLFDKNDVVEHLLKSNADVYARDSYGFTPIHLAMSSSRRVANLLLEATPNLRDSVSSVGLSHLHVAAWANNQRAVADLLRNGADIERVIVDSDVDQSFPALKDWVGQTPLLVARYAEDAARSLLNAGANVHAKDLEGVSALRHALGNMSSDAIDPIIDKMRVGECEAESCGMTSLHVACGVYDLEWAEELLENGADVNARIDDDDHELHGATPLHVLVYYRITLGTNDQELVDFVEMLLDYGADVSVATSAGSTALHLIYEHAYRDRPVDGADFFLTAADLLLRSLKSYDVNPVNHQGLSHFHFACVRNDVETATKFLDHGADVNETMDPFDPRSHGFAPLHLVMAHRCREVAYLLLERGADVNVEDVHGNKPLHIAVKNNFVDLPLIEAMIGRGADHRAVNFNDETLLYCLLKFSYLTLDEYLQTFEFLRKYSCNLDQHDKDGTPLNVASSFYNIEAVNALLQLGADMNTLDIENKFPVDEMFTYDFNQRQIDVFITFLIHVWKMRFIGLDVRESHLRCLEEVEDRFLNFNSLEQICQDELKKARETEICQGMTVKDFLSELGAVAEYPRMSSIRQSIVDKFFKHTAYLRREFPEFCGFLAVQYEKILPRMELWYPAKEAAYFISNIDLPDICSEAILRFFTNSDMELLIESVKGFM